MRRPPARPALVSLALMALLGAGCAPSDDNAASSPSATPTAPAASSASTSASASASASVDPCAKGSLKTRTAGKLTIGTDEPVYPPWFVDDKPQNGKGYEGAVAAAVAKAMGFAPTEVTWTRVQFNAAIAPGPKKYDFDINEFSINADRKKAVDFSSPYYDVTQAVVTTATSKAAKATTLADLKGLKLGAQIGTTSYDAIRSQIAPSKTPGVYNDNDTAAKALDNGQVDAVVVDLPTAFYMAGAQLKNGKIIGQLPSSGGTPEQFGLVLDKGSALTTCVSKAVDALRADGTLKAAEQQWLAKQGAPVLR